MRFAAAPVHRSTLLGIRADTPLLPGGDMTEAKLVHA